MDPDPAPAQEPVLGREKDTCREDHSGLAGEVLGQREASGVGGAMGVLGEKEVLEGERILLKIPRKRTPEVKSRASLPQLRHQPVGR